MLKENIKDRLSLPEKFVLNKKTPVNKICVPVLNEPETVALAQKLAKHILSPYVIALYGPLGAGKSTFARAFIQALADKKEEIPSPTFTLVQEYLTKVGPAYHLDLYRLNHFEEAYELGVEDLFATGICLCEWPEKIQSILPKNRLDIYFEIQEDNRILTFEQMA